MMNLQCVIFDMDGVIIESEEFHKKAYFETFNELGIEVSEELYSTFLGNSTINTFQKIVELFNLPQAPEDLVLVKRKKYVDMVSKDPDFKLIDGVLELIQHFFNKGLKLVLASSSSMGNIKLTFDRFDLHPYFVGKISGADLPQSKPHPDIFIKAAEIAKTPRENCVIIEDSKSGIQAANSAEIFSIGYKPSYSSSDLSKADLIVTSHYEIMDKF